jgi:hypothetical protein
LQIRVFTDHGKKTNTTRDGEKVVRGLTEEVWGGKVESGKWKVEGWAEGGTASRKPGEMTDNGPRWLEFGKTIWHEGKKNVSMSTRRKDDGER